MKKRPFLRNSCRGFTLIEVILTLILVAFAGLMLMELTGTSLTQSVLPLKWIREEFVLKQRMELLTAEYVSWVNNSSISDGTAVLNASTFQTIVTNDSVMPPPPKFIKFNETTNKVWIEADDDTGNNRNLKVTVTEGDVKAVVIFSQIKNDDTMSINY